MVSSHRLRFVAIAVGVVCVLDGRTPAHGTPPGEFKLVTQRMSTGRNFPSAVLLADGKVLVTGGEVLKNGLVTLASAEIFDPETETFTLTGAMTESRIGHTSVLLKDGRVLVVGGFGDGEERNMRTTAEVYDPVTGAFSRAGDVAVTRVFPTATLLRDGRVLIVGGTETPDATMGNDIAEIFDPATGEIQTTGALSEGRALHAAVLLPDGRGLIVGGSGSSIWSSALIYIP
jgi:hypothetical protein